MSSTDLQHYDITQLSVEEDKALACTGWKEVW